VEGGGNMHICQTRQPRYAQWIHSQAPDNCLEISAKTHDPHETEKYLMRNDKDTFLTFELHDYWFKSYYDVSVRFAASITEIEFVVVAGGEILGISLLREPQLLQSEEGDKKLQRPPDTSCHRTCRHRARQARSSDP
jgi:hypothetical protein